MDKMFERELARVLNQHSIDSYCGTPDFVLAEMLTGFIESFRASIKKRDNWHTSKPTMYDLPLLKPKDTP